MQDGPNLNSGAMTMQTKDAFVESDVVDDKAPGELQGATMLEHPVFVCWCSSCGEEAADESLPCPRCRGPVRRHQRILELPDEDSGALSLATLRAALADVSASSSDDTGSVLLSEQGPDASVAASNPTLACELAALGVPRAVQRALVKRGFSSLEQITAAATSEPHEGAMAVKLGLSPSAEVLLRRLWHAAAERRSDTQRAAQRRRRAEEQLPVRCRTYAETCPSFALPCDLASPVPLETDDDDEDEDLDALPRGYARQQVTTKRLRVDRSNCSDDDSEAESWT